jgi:hypothetical protein
MPSRSHSLSDHSALHLALIAFVCVVMGLLSGSPPTRLAGTDWPTRQIDDRVEQIEAPNHTAVPMVCLDIRFAEDLPNELVEPAEPTDDDETDEDETKHYILRSDLAAFGSPTGLYESSADRAALTRFQLLAFSSRGSPSA